MFNNIEFTFISPEELEMPKKIINFLKEHNINFIETQDYKN
jgi:aspartate carbamoyltransferase catalytic subunit